MIPSSYLLHSSCLACSSLLRCSFHRAILATMVRGLLFNFAGLRASKYMFEELLEVILRAPMAFFDTTPVGRIMNRFSKDLYTIDEDLVSSLRSYLTTVMPVLSTIIVVTSVTPMFIVGLVPCFFFYAHQQNFFTMTYRELSVLTRLADHQFVLCSRKHLMDA